MKKQVSATRRESKKIKKKKKVDPGCAGFGPEPEVIKKVPTGTW